LENLQFTAAEAGIISVQNLTAPDADTSSTFQIRTASPDGKLRKISGSPVVLVGAGTSVPTITIAEARKLPPDSIVTIKGTVVIGANVLRSTTVSANVYDESQRGINIYSSSADATLKRGNLLLITGMLEAYVGSQNDTAGSICGLSE